MPEFKERPKSGRQKAMRPGTALPKQAIRQLKEKYIKELEKSPEEPQNPGSRAADQVEQAGRWAVKELAGAAAPARRLWKQKKSPQKDSDAFQGTGAECPSNAAQPEDRPQANAPKERKTTEHRPREGSQMTGHSDLKKRPASVGRSDKPPAASRSNGAGSPLASPSLNNRRRGSAAFHRTDGSGGQGAGQRTPFRKAHFTSPNSPGTGRRSAPKERSRPMFRSRKSPQAGAGLGSAARRPFQAGGPRQTAQQHMKRQAVSNFQKTRKGLVTLTKKLTAAVVKAASALVSSLVSLVGGGVLLIAIVIIIVIGAVASSPFGLFFAQERNAPGTLSVAEAVNEVHIAYNTQLEQLQSGSYDDIVIEGQAADWPEVLAVFAVRFAGADDGVDVATLDADRVAKLTAVFWDMTEISSWVEAIEHPSSGDSGGWTEYILHIVITAKTADDMRTVYAFTDYQNSALDELLADRAALSSLAGSLSITNADARAVLDALPEDLSPERRAVVETALTLYGKVTYFWGGKSLVLGWDSQWGQLTKVTAAGSPTTGTYRPYGLDCSGMVDWVFYNVTGGEYVIGHGGGAHAQHTYCDTISWDEAQPGDLVFYPDDEHVGIVCGRDESGGLLVIHCSSGANNVVITGTSGFTSVARPFFYNE